MSDPILMPSSIRRRFTLAKHRRSSSSSSGASSASGIPPSPPLPRSPASASFVGTPPASPVSASMISSPTIAHNGDVTTAAYPTPNPHTHSRSRSYSYAQPEEPFTSPRIAPSPPVPALPLHATYATQLPPVPARAVPAWRSNLLSLASSYGSLADAEHSLQARAALDTVIGRLADPRITERQALAILRAYLDSIHSSQRGAHPMSAGPAAAPPRTPATPRHATTFEFDRAFTRVAVNRHRDVYGVAI